MNNILAQLPALTDVQRAAFRSRIGDAECASLGAQTQSALVLREATTWAKIIQGALVTFAGPLQAYTPARFAWFVECAQGLAQAAQAQQQSAGSVGAARGNELSARQAALAAREALDEKLALLAGQDAAAMAELQAAFGTTETALALVQSVKALASLASTWLASSNPQDEALVASVNLTAGDVDTANQAAQALTDAASSAVGTRAQPKDGPAVNLAEGRVLFEMKAVRGVFEKARSKTPAVPSLPIGSGTRRVLAPHKRAATPAPAAAGATATAGSTATPAPAAATTTVPAATGG